MAYLEAREEGPTILDLERTLWLVGLALMFALGFRLGVDRGETDALREVCAQVQTRPIIEECK